MTKTSDVRLETELLGAIFNSPSLIKRVDFVSRETFSDQSLGKLWDMMLECAVSGGTISPSALFLRYPQEVEALGGTSFLDKVKARGINLETDFLAAADHLRQLYLWRKIDELSSRLKSNVENQEAAPDDILSGFQSYAQMLLSGGRDTARTRSEVATAAIQRAREAKEIVTTGITNLDYLLQGGLQRRRMYGIGGHRGKGKTILLGSISGNLNLQGEKHLFISLETEPEDIEIRHTAKHLETNASVMFDHDHPDHATIVDEAGRIQSSLPDNCLYEFKPGATLNQIYRMILRAKNRHNIRGFMLDYIQLVQGREKGQTEAGHMRAISSKLAALCRTENLWGIVTAQHDHRGNIIMGDGLIEASSLFVNMVRGEDDEAAYFQTEKSNYTRYADTGGEATAGMIFDMQSGPHFRDTDQTDIPGLIERQGENVKDFLSV